MYKFFGVPLQKITLAGTNDVIFRFDTKGEYITDDQRIIDRALGKFDHQELKAEPVGERVKKTFTIPAIQISTNEPDEKLKCKKCDFVAKDQGELMRHYKEHKKGE